MFMRVRCNHHEWGFEVPDGCIPSVGDKIFLWYGMPDAESEECTYGTVVEREWCFYDDDINEQEVSLSVKLQEKIPEGYIADSPVWPSIEQSKRKAECAEELAKIRET